MLVVQLAIWFIALSLFLSTSTLVSSAYAESPASDSDTETELFHLTMTAYNAVEQQTSRHPNITASSSSANAQIVVAVTPKLLKKLPFGTVVRFTYSGSTQSQKCGFRYVQNRIGYRIVLDKMNPKMNRDLDILFGNNDMVNIEGGKRVNSSVALGTCRDVSIKIVGFIDMRNQPLPETQNQLLRIIKGQLQAGGEQAEPYEPE